MFTVNEYVEALKLILPNLSEKKLRMLKLNYLAPGRSITPRQISSALGWATGGASHPHYADLGKVIARQIGKKIKPFRDGIPHPVRVLAEFRGSRPVYWEMWPNLAAAIEQLGIVDCHEENIFPDEAQAESVLSEGATYRVQVNAYERNPDARAKCIEHFGAICQVCNFDFGVVWGELMNGFIHVHHLKPLSEIQEEYFVDPVNDLRPVCPNCHAVIHSRRPALSIEEARVLLNRGVSR